MTRHSSLTFVYIQLQRDFTLGTKRRPRAVPLLSVNFACTRVYRHVRSLHVVSDKVRLCVLLAVDNKVVVSKTLRVAAVMFYITIKGK